MAITLETAARNAAADAIGALVDGGTLQILTSGDVVLAELTFSGTAFGAAASGTATAAAITQDSSANATGTAAKFFARSTAPATVFSGSVTATSGGGDIELVTTSIVSGQPVQITSFTITMPAS
jgi:hypothetical protein